MFRATDKTCSTRTKIWCLGAGIITLLFVGGWLVALRSDDLPIPEKSRLVLTGSPRSLEPPNSPWSDRASSWWKEIKYRFAKKPSTDYSVLPAKIDRWTIGPILNHCAMIAGVRYVIERDVASGTVLFSPTNTIPVSEWVTGFIKALQTGQAEWVDSQSGEIRREKLVVVTNGVKTVMVLRKEAAREFRRKKGN